MNGQFRNGLITLVITLVCFLSVGYTACSKDNTTPVPDECEKVQCLNGSSCFKGVCSCLSGFEGRYCEINTLTRYIGTWKTKERIVSSSKAANVNVTRDYNWTIKAKPNSRTEFLIDDFMGNNGYDNVWCTEARNEKYELSPYTNFAFEKSQNIAGSSIYITGGAGSVNDLGTNMTGRYFATYVDGTTLVNDTVSFSSELIQ